MTDVALIQVPYYLGQRDVVLGLGPGPLAEAIGGESVVVEREEPFRNEVGASFDLIRGVARAVRETIAAGRFPLVLAGNCYTSLGTVAGIGREVGVVWFDAHGDFNTPETTPTGFFDGFGLAMLTGSGWETLRETVDGIRTVPERNVVLAGARDLDPREQERLAAAEVLRADASTLDAALADLRTRVDAVYVHVDFDVLDPSEGIANELAVEDGFTAAELEHAFDSISARFEIPAAAFTAYDPRFDEAGRVPPIAARLARRLVPEAVAS